MSDAFMRAHRAPLFGCLIASALLSTAAFAASPAGAAKPGAMPDFGGGWQMSDGRKFTPSGDGAQPVVDDPAHPHIDRGVDARGRDVTNTVWVGDATNPNLTPWAAAAVKKAGDDGLRGHAPATAESTCYPAGVPDILNFFEPVFFLQGPKEVTILYQRGPNVRHVYLNAKHSAHPKSSWYGESVGHYEGDTLVVDTIGLNDKTVVDRFNTPHGPAMHVIERYHVAQDGKTMQIDLKVDDPKTYNKPWTGHAVYARVRQPRLEESICAENNTDFFTGKLFPIPVAAKPGF
jgi:hypothetical protein